MGDRYFLTVICPKCDKPDDDVYYAPTCGIKFHHCKNCGRKINLEKYTGITEDMASNKAMIKEMIGAWKAGEL